MISTDYVLTSVVVSGKSQNGKTGPMPTISRPIDATCPRTCPFIPKQFGGNGQCYANGRQNGSVKKFARDMTVADVVSKIRADRTKNDPAPKYIRDRVVGDIVADPDGSATPEVGYLLAVADVARQVGATAYGYTHAFDSLTPDDVATVAESGYVLNASCNTVDDIRRAVLLGMPTTYAGDDLVDGDVLYGRRIVTCPEQTGRVKDCLTCGLCAKPRACTVRFLIH